MSSLNAEPTLTAFDQRDGPYELCSWHWPLYPVGIDPGNDISVGPPLNDGRYFVGLYNPSLEPVSDGVPLGFARPRYRGKRYLFSRTLTDRDQLGKRMR